LIHLPPPDEAIACIKVAEANLAALQVEVTVSGRADQVRAWLQAISSDESWQVNFGKQVGTERSITVVGPSAVSWGQVGQLDYEARSRKLVITFASLPKICEFKYSNAQTH
jgi:hypothetical protein